MKVTALKKEREGGLVGTLMIEANNVAEHALLRVFCFALRILKYFELTKAESTMSSMAPRVEITGLDSE